MTLEDYIAKEFKGLVAEGPWGGSMPDAMRSLYFDGNPGLMAAVDDGKRVVFTAVGGPISAAEMAVQAYSREYPEYKVYIMSLNPINPT